MFYYKQITFKSVQFVFILFIYLPILFPSHGKDEQTDEITGTVTTVKQKVRKIKPVKLYYPYFK